MPLAGVLNIFSGRRDRAVPINRSGSIAPVPTDEHLRIVVRKDEDMVVLRLIGELDLAGAPVFQSEIDSAEIGASAAVVLDLSELRFIDSSGLRVIFSAHARSVERGQRFALTKGSEQVQRLLSITRVGEHVRIIDSPEDMREEP
jgi:anti-anti-sigma factor